MDTLERTKVWDINNPSAVRLHRAIAKMLVIDIEPYHVVEKQGFIEMMTVVERRYNIPSRKYFAERMIPQIYEEVCARLTGLLDPDMNWSISFTTDTWTAENTVQSFMGLTAHWLTDAFVNMSFVLDCSPFAGHHTADGLLCAFQQMLSKWNIDSSRCHVVLRDNAANISKCFRIASIPSLGCFAHTLQLCVRDGLLSQRAVSDIVTVSRKLVGHFKHSSSATSRLKELQAELGLPHHQLIQDVSTRWNSTFYMLRRLCEQRRALSVYCSEVDGASCPTAYRWSIAENVVSLLAPFEECTRDVSSDAARIFVVIPLVAILRNILSRYGNDAGVKTLKSSLLESVNERFANIQEEPLYAISSLTDPRFKQKFFTEAVLTTIKANAILAFNGSSSNSGSATATATVPTSSTPASLDTESVTLQPPLKKARVENSVL